MGSRIVRRGRSESEGVTEELPGQWSVVVFPVISEENDVLEGVRTVNMNKVHPGSIVIGGITLVRHFVATSKDAEDMMSRVAESTSEGMILTGKRPLKSRRGMYHKWPISDNLLVLHGIEEQIYSETEGRKSKFVKTAIGNGGMSRTIAIEGAGILAPSKDLWVPDVTLMKKTEDGLAHHMDFELKKFEQYAEPAGQ